jgi:uncharacterized membrane protein YdfJ with MMPL/SSD domain
MYPIAKYVVRVTQFTPSLMMSLIIAMSIDYSLFLLSRFLEDFSDLQDKKIAIAQMVKHSGRKFSSVEVTPYTIVFFFADNDFFKYVYICCALLFQAPS